MISSSASAGAALSSLVPVSEESVKVSDVIIRALADKAMAKARAAVAATSGVKLKSKSMDRSAKEYRERMEAQNVEICIEAQISAAREEEEARDRAMATRMRRAETKRAERNETAWIERERTEAGRRGSYR